MAPLLRMDQELGYYSDHLLVKSFLEHALRFNFQMTNNESEYEALIAGLGLARALGIEHIKAHCDSQLVASQYNGDYETKDE